MCNVHENIKEEKGAQGKVWEQPLKWDIPTFYSTNPSAHHWSCELDAN